MAQARFYIPYKNGQPDLTEEEMQIVNENQVGYGCIEEVHHNMPNDRVFADVYAPPEIIEQMKNNPRFEFVEDVLESYNGC